jgi:hypothetical protein
VRKRIEYLKTDGCERIKRDYNKKKSERYWDDEIYHQRSDLLNQLISFNTSTFEGLKIIYCFFINLLTGMQKHTK